LFANLAERWPVRDASGSPKPEPAPERLAAPKVHVLADSDWPATGSVQTQHAGLFLLLPELVELDLLGLIEAAGWPSASQLQALHSHHRHWW